MLLGDGSSIRVVTPPTWEPVSIAEARAQCRYESTDEDSLLGELVTAAREMVESDTRRALVTQTLELDLDRFPSLVIELRKPPVQSVSFLKYIEPVAGTLTTLSGATWAVDTYGEPARVTPVFGTYWPVARLQPSAVQIQFVAGYTTPDLIPRRAKQAIRLLVAHWFYHREEVGKIGPAIEMGYEALVARLRWSSGFSRADSSPVAGGW